ncbi:hypothetical protein BMMGA3_17170 (plasmid) [Bacillus methanolicus MGA3]|uniref:Uncharacterized protein n=2 Tax=Bacillus methanolicus TaxID=1471 RepID=A0A068LVK0_BACMM|nr:hypothetical protein BMMGA3_17170 [Bacillus methanolicus MGA3]
MIMEQFGPGKTISFRLPSDTPKHVSDYLTERKQKLGRKFSSEIAPIFVQAISQQVLKTTDEDILTIPLPKGFTKEQKEWLRHPNTRALIGQMLYQFVQDPLKPIDLGSTRIEQKEGRKTSQSFTPPKNISNFAKRTFLNFDDDDDD